jgi:hypothetical protein
LGKSLNSLKDKIDSKSPFDQLDKIVDEKIPPLLNGIFKLNLAEEEHHGGEGDHAEKRQDHGQNESDNSTESGNHG